MIARRTFFAIGAMCLVPLALACGEILDASPLPEPAEAGPDVVSPADAAPSDASDGGLPAFDLAFRPPCPRPKAPGNACTTAPLGCKRTRIYQPATRNHPFGIAVDARHVFWLAQPLTASGYNGHDLATLYRLDRVTSEVVELAQNQLTATKLHAHGAELFWAVNGDSGYELRSLRKDAPPCDAAGCTMARRVASVSGKPQHIGAAVQNSVVVVQESGETVHVALDHTPPVTSVLANTRFNPGFVAGKEVVFASGFEQPSVLRFNANGTDGGTLGTIPKADAATGPGTSLLATSCKNVYAVVSGNNVQVQPAVANGGAFTAFGSVPPQVSIHATASDARFLYFAAVNGGGLRRLEIMAGGEAQVLTTGSVWELDVSDDVIVYGEHGLSGSDSNPDIGSIFQLEK